MKRLGVVTNRFKSLTADLCDVLGQVVEIFDMIFLHPVNWIIQYLKALASVADYEQVRS